MRTVIDASYQLEINVDPVDSTFVSAVLPATAGALVAKGHQLILELISALESRHDADEPLDRLWVRAYPKFSPMMVAHYANGRPPLAELLSGPMLTAMDNNLAQLVTILGAINLKPIMRQVREDEVRADDAFAGLLSLVGWSPRGASAAPRGTVKPDARAGLVSKSAAPPPSPARPVTPRASTPRPAGGLSRGPSSVLVKPVVPSHHAPAVAKQRTEDPLADAIAGLLPASGLVCPKCRGTRKVSVSNNTGPLLACSTRACGLSYLDVAVLNRALSDHDARCACGERVRVDRAGKAAPFAGCSKYKTCSKTGYSSWSEMVRQVRLFRDASQALTEGNDVRMRSLLPGLPGDGSLSRRLSAALLASSTASTKKVESARAPIRNEAGLSDAAAVVDGDHDFLIVEDTFDPPELFSVEAKGGVVRVRVNRAHEAFTAICNPATKSVDPGVGLVLAALAALEVEAGSTRRRDRLKETRADLARVLRRMVRRQALR